MSEQAKTVEETIREVGETYRERGRVEAWEVIERCVRDLQRYLPYLAVAHLIPGADAVVTEEGLLAAANCIPEVTTSDCLCGRRHHHRRSFGERKAIARAALEAAGITVCNEVVEVSNDDGDPCPKSIIFWVPGDEEYSVLDMCFGDRIYIVRADTSTESTRSDETSKDGTGIDRCE
jgi:hypothetical protein